jgi:predicted nucleic acid-binding protein
MSAAAETFFDTNVLLYLLSADEAKADRAEEVLAQGGIVSVQVLNEFAAVATSKLRLTFAETREALVAIRAVCRVRPLDEDVHDLGLRIAERYELSIYDSMIVAAARIAECKVILSEDMQDGLRLDGGLRVRNPFKHGRG